MTRLRKGWTARLGRHRVDPHAVGGGLDGAAPGEGHHPGLGRGVVGLAGLGPPSEHGGVVDDDPARALGVEVAKGGPRAPEGAGQGHVEDGGPLLVGHVHDLDLAAEAGVVHGHVEATVVSSGLVVEVLDLGLVGHVAEDGQWPGPRQLAEGVGRLAQAPLVGVGDDDGGSLLDAAPGRGEPDAGPGRGGDDHDLALEQAVAGWRCRAVRRHVGHRIDPLGSRGSPSTRSPMMLRWIWFEPP